MSNEDKRITMEELLEDRKKDCSNIDAILRFFAIPKECRPDLERREYNEPLYSQLKWQGKDFDVINSFWTVFKCALIVVVQQGGSKFEDYKNCYCFDNITSFPYLPLDKDPKFNKDGTLERISYPLRYLQCLRQQTTPDLIKIVNEACENSNLQQLAALCHCAANFMPCPDNVFNQAKGTVYIKFKYNDKEIKWSLTYDFLPLMIDLINSTNELNGNAAISLKLSTKDTISNACILFSQDGKEINLKWKTIGNWKTWFVDNREKYCLEDYYNIYADPIDPNIKHIKGVPMFKTQCLSYPVPREKDEVEECLNEMVNRIMSRACRLEKKLNEESKQNN